MLVHLKCLNSFGFEQFWKKEFVFQKIPRVAAYESGLRFPKFNMVDIDPKNLKLENKKKYFGTLH